MYCGTDKISWTKFAIAVELFVEVETATHRLSDVMKKDPNYYHVPGWFDYVSALGASLLVDATGKLFRDYKSRDETKEDDEYEESDSELESDFEIDEETIDESQTIKRSIEKSGPSKPMRGHPLLSLEYLVSSLSIFEVSVEHDTIYAMLAIAKDTTPSASTDDVYLDQTQRSLEMFTQKKRYTVDYNAPYSDVCKDFIKFCVDRSLKTDPTRALDVICRPWATEMRDPKAPPEKRYLRRRSTDKRLRKASRSFLINHVKTSSFSSDNVGPAETASAPTTLPKLPSWIPQLSAAPYGMYPQAGINAQKMGRKNADTLVGLPSQNQRNYSAAETKAVDLKALKWRQRIAMGHHSMYVRGFALEKVASVEESSQAGAIPREWAALAGWNYAPRGKPPDDFWRTLVADRGRDGKNPPVYYSKACKESFVKGSLKSGSVNTSSLIDNERSSVVAQFCRRVQAVIWNRALIKTKSDFSAEAGGDMAPGRLGLVNKGVKPGDIVAILYGCSVPVILRKSEKKGEEEMEKELLFEIDFRKQQIVNACRRELDRRETFYEKREKDKKQYRLWEAEIFKQYRRDITWKREYKERYEADVRNGKRKRIAISTRDFTENNADSKEVKAGKRKIKEWREANLIDINGFKAWKKEKLESSRAARKALEETAAKAAQQRPCNSTKANGKPTVKVHENVNGFSTPIRARKFSFAALNTTSAKGTEMSRSNSRVREKSENESALPRAGSVDWKAPVAVDWEIFEKRLVWGRYWKRIIKWRKEQIVKDRQPPWKTKQDIQEDNRAPTQETGFTVVHRSEDSALTQQTLHAQFKDGDQHDNESMSMDQKSKPHRFENGHSHIEQDNFPQFKDIAVEQRKAEAIEEPNNRKRLLRPDEVSKANRERQRYRENQRTQQQKYEKEGKRDPSVWPCGGKICDSDGCDGETCKENQHNIKECPQQTRRFVGLCEDCAMRYHGAIYSKMRHGILKKEEQEDGTIKAIRKGGVNEDQWWHYQLLGEAYIHGMMDGEAMAYQNQKGIPSQVFELR
jgi:hypothetical protein